MLFPLLAMSLIRLPCLRWMPCHVKDFIFCWCKVRYRLTYILSDVRINIIPIWFLGQKNASKVWVESERFVHLVFSQLPMPWNHPQLPQRWNHSAFITGICLMRLTTSTTHIRFAREKGARLTTQLFFTHISKVTKSDASHQGRERKSQNHKPTLQLKPSSFTDSLQLIKDPQIWTELTKQCLTHLDGRRNTEDIFETDKTNNSALCTSVQRWKSG